MSVAVVKLGVGNTASVMFALERLGVDALLTDDPAAIADAERVILPGVGAARRAMLAIDEKGLHRALTKFPRPLLGICLGQQLLFESSAEGGVDTLGLLPGRVERLVSGPEAPTPHMGWSRLIDVKEHALLEGVSEGAYCYFVHSYICPVGAATLASAEYESAFAAVVGAGCRFGCQFHPERSGAVGARILSNFVSLQC